MQKADEISAALVEAFGPDAQVRDVSAAHHGHAGAPDGGESHFEVDVPTSSVAGMARLERERAVHRALGPDLMGRIHALQVRFV